MSQPMISAEVSSGESFGRPPETARAKFFFWGVGAVVAIGLGLVLTVYGGDLTWDLSAMLAWVLAIAAADWLQIRLWRSVTLSMSLAVTLSAGMVFPPIQAALLAFVGSVDPREFRGQISASRGIFNRSQVAAATFLASAAFHAFGVPITRWPLVLLPTFLSLTVDFLVNSALVGIAAFLIHGLSPKRWVTTTLGVAPFEYSLGYVSLGILAALMAVTYGSLAAWGLLAFMVPLSLAYSLFVLAQRSRLAAERLESKNRALLEAIQQTAAERRDERRVVAGELHDEVLPPIFKVHLMGEVLRRDLQDGRLLALDEDIPELLDATQTAQVSIRKLVSGLRRASLGVGGLNDTVRLLVEKLEGASTCRFQLKLEEVDASQYAQLLAYQVIREAMENAVRHSRAKSVKVSVSPQGSSLELRVCDDGVGFDRDSLDDELHFGMQMISERVEAAGGWLLVDSKLGEGTRVCASIPSEL